MKKIIMAATLLCMGIFGMQAQTLKFNSNKKFKIVQFTDIHWVPGNPASEEAAKRMNEVLDAEKPDLVIYTGDLIFAKPAAEGLDKALEPAISRHIPFAVTWGNHDDEQDMNRKELSDYIEKKAGCLNTRTEGISGVTNFILPVNASAGNNEAAVLYIFDSNAYSPLK
jgi:predicted MPP superfamily phosphohydrolase